MKNKIAISIILTLLMVVSTVNVATGYTTTECNVPDLIVPNEIGVVKEVWNGSAWTDEYTAEVGEDIDFRITITYNSFCGYKAMFINVSDSIDSIGEISYTLNSFNIEPNEIGNPIIWNLTQELYDGDSIEILYNLTITCGCGELVNVVSVEALERCCGVPMYGDDSARVIVECEEPCIPGIEVEKTVYNETTQEWVEYLEDLTLDDLVTFKIVITYDDCDSGYKLLNAIVRDTLPCCLEYNETIDISTTSEYPMDYPTIEVSADGKLVYWNWTFSESFKIEAGDSITILFKTKFVNYCESIGENWAYVEAWGCSGPTFSARDKAEVDCTPPDTTFEKKVYDGNELVDEINVTVGDILRFRLELNYYGFDPLYDIQFYDELPCILIYDDNLASNVINISDYINVSEDKKHIWWNLTGITLNDGETIWIEFDAEVTGATECGCDCDIDAENFAFVQGVIVCSQEPDFYMEDTVIIHSYGNCPPSRPSITGPATGFEGDELTFKFVSTDSDGDKIKYNILWGDTLGELGFTYYNSDEEVTKTHTYSTAGTYKIKAEAVDEHGASYGYTPAGYEYTVVIKKPDQPPQEGIKINGPTKFNMKLLSACIENIGDSTVNDIDWNFTIYKEGLLGGWSVETNGTIETLEGESSKCISSGAVTFKLGKATIEINAKSGDLEDSYTASAFVIGRIIIVQAPVETM